MATFLGGLFLLGIGANLLIDGAQDDVAYLLGYFGLASVTSGVIAFLYSFVASCLREQDETMPLLPAPPPTLKPLRRRSSEPSPIDV